MLVSTMKYTRRFNVAQYEHEEITVDVVPDDGQSAEALLAETRAFVEGSRPKVNGAYILTNGKPAPPLAPKADPPKHPAPPAACAVPADSMVPVLEQSIAATKAVEPPFTPNETPAPAPAKRKGRPPKAEAEARKALESWRASANLDDFLVRFNELRSKAAVIPADAWDGIIHKEARALYAAINIKTPGTQDTIDAIVKAMKSEQTALAERKATA